MDKRTPSHEVTLKVELFNTIPDSEEQFLRERIPVEVKSRVGIAINKIDFVLPGIFESKFKKTVVVN